MGIDEGFGALRQILQQVTPVVTEDGVASFFRNPIADRFPGDWEPTSSSGRAKGESAAEPDCAAENNR
jgi:hypothetical protein